MKTKSNKIIFECDEKVGTIYLNNPQKLNAFDIQLIKELDKVLEKIKKSNLKVILVRGKGSSFCSGGDILWERELGNLSKKNTKAQMQYVQKVFSKIESSPQIFIAIIHGYAVGGGNELSMACDIRVALTSAKFSHPEASLGTVAPLGGTKRLPRLIGLGRSKYMLFTGAIINSKTACNWNLVDFVVSEKEIKSFLNSMIIKLVNIPNNVIKLTKKSVNKSYVSDLNDEKEVDAYVECSKSKENKERLDKFLKNKSN